VSLWSIIGTVGGALLGGPAGAALGASLGGAIDTSKASKDAGKQQQAATDAAIAEQRRQYDTTRDDYAPYRAAGTNALTQLQGDIDKPTTAADVMSDPGYQFGLDQGQQAIDRKVAAMGGRVSGAAIKSAARFGVGTATAGYGAAYQRKQDRLNRLASIAGLGQTATAGGALMGQNTANNVSGAISSQGDASAAGTIARGNIWANTGNQLAAMYGRSKTGG
jgi:hypothetical protein